MSSSTGNCAVIVVSVYESKLHTQCLQGMCLKCSVHLVYLKVSENYKDFTQDYTLHL